MKLGLFMMPLHPPAKPLAQTYDEDHDLLVLADELGFSEAWIGEHATMAWENIPAPDQFIARVFPDTKQIRLGTGVVLMAQHHPANTANRIAQLDHLTKGRINFGIGVGNISTDLELFGIDGQAGLPGIMLYRAIDLILKMWAEDPPYDFPGQFWPVRVRNPVPELGLGGPLKPYQKPHPPIALPGLGGQSRLMFTAGQRGWIPMSSNLTHHRFLKGHWDQVMKGAATSGLNPHRSIWRICREVYVDDTARAAQAYARRGSLAQAYEDYFFKMFRRSGNDDLFKSHDDMPQSEINLDYIIDNMWLVGDPDQVARQIRELYDHVGGFGGLLMVTHDWDDPARWQNSMRLLATEVMPRVADLG
jgi:alkanesulfonate monooxygenase SsuD/methylene tetrahydromethanopterin reductase-like flavin-dependent oxidoreductase (luciferase family)